MSRITTQNAAPAVPRAPGQALTWTARAAATIMLAAILLQAATAGGLLSGVRAEASLHAAGAMIVFAAGIFLLVVTILWWRPGHGAGWPALVAVAILAGSVMQAMLGGAHLVAAHVPTGVGLVVLATWMAVWAWTSPREVPELHT